MIALTKRIAERLFSRKLLLGGALLAAPLLMAGEASADHKHRYRHGHYRPDCGYDRYHHDHHSGYRYGHPYAPRVYGRPPIPSYFGGHPYSSRYGVGYPWYGSRGTSLGISPRGFSLYIGR